MNYLNKINMNWMYMYIHTHKILFYLYSASCQSLSFQMTDIFKEYLQKNTQNLKNKNSKLI